MPAMYPDTVIWDECPTWRAFDGDEVARANGRRELLHREFATLGGITRGGCGDEQARQRGEGRHETQSRVGHGHGEGAEGGRDGAAQRETRTVPRRSAIPAQMAPGPVFYPAFGGEGGTTSLTPL